MIIFPAIDLFGAKAVRLYKGDYEKMTVFSDKPVDKAKSFADDGAEWIHLVDLEGAKDGSAVNFDTIKRIASESGLKCEVGGGIRTEATVKKYLDAGVERIILGTAAVSDRPFLERMCEKYKGHIAVGADIKNGCIAVKGWTQLADSYKPFMEELSKLEIDALICTDVSRDGAMRGTNTELYDELSRDFGFRLVASGGVSSMDDVIRLKALGIYGAIIGKALYTGDIELKKAIEAAK